MVLVYRKLGRSTCIFLERLGKEWKHIYYPEIYTVLRDVKQWYMFWKSRRLHISTIMFAEGQNEGESNPLFSLFLGPNGGEKMGFTPCTVYFGSV
jgi:hypothetical protein